MSTSITSLSSGALAASEGFSDKTWLDMTRGLLNDDPSDVDVETAIYYLKANLGDLPADELAEMVESLSEPEPECICPPDLLARGGFKGRCPVHG